MEGNKTNDKSDQKIQKKSEKDRNGIIGGLVFGMILLFATYQILAKHSDDREYPKVCVNLQTDVR